MTTRQTLTTSGVISLAESVCTFYGFSVDAVLTPNTHERRMAVRDVLIAVLYLMGWTEERVATELTVHPATVEHALCTVKDCEARRFLPRKAS